MDTCDIQMIVIHGWMSHTDEVKQFNNYKNYNVIVFRVYSL